MIDETTLHIFYEYLLTSHSLHQSINQYHGLNVVRFSSYIIKLYIINFYAISMVIAFTIRVRKLIGFFGKVGGSIPVDRSIT